MKVQNKVKAAKALFPLSLHFQVTLNPKETLKFFNYKKGCPSTMSELIIAINKLIPVKNYPGDNPNNGDMSHNFRVGREYSQVLYLEVIKAYLPKDFDYIELANKLKLLAINAHCDEYMIIENSSEPFMDGITGEFLYRFWWD